MTSCSFQDSVGGSNITCGLNVKVLNQNEVVPLQTCDRPIRSHLANYHINPNTVDSEGELIKARGGLFNRESSSLTVCPNHRQKLGIGWTCRKYCSLLYCPGYKSLTKGTISKHQSQYLLQNEKKFIGIGSGLCSQCRKALIDKLRLEPPLESQSQHDKNNYYLKSNQGSIDVLKSLATPSSTPGFVIKSPNQDTDSEELITYTDDTESQPLDLTYSQGSIWTPSSSQDDNFRKRKALDDFLEVCGLSPVKKTLSTNWLEASERTKADYIKKSRAIFNEVIKVIAPNQEDTVSDILLTKPINAISEDANILDIISSAYKITTNWGTQRQLLSMVATKFTFAEIQVHIPDLTKYRFSAARKHSIIVGHGQPISNVMENRISISELQIGHFLDFVMSPAIMTDIPFGEMKLKLQSGEKICVPKIILNSIRSRVVEQYQQYCMETDFPAFASYRSYMRILSAIEPNIRKCMKGLDNYAAEGAKAFEDLHKVVDQFGTIGKSKDWCEEVKKSLLSSKQYLKLEYKLHITKSSRVMDHCCQYALSAESKEYASDCDHVHDQDCVSCVELKDTLAKLDQAVNDVNYETEDQKDDITYIVHQCIKAIQEWKMHILRTFNQDQARSQIMENLQDDEILIERDWAMKFVPMVYRESQSKWFGKRGLNWHITVGTNKENGKVVSQTIVHIFDNATQDITTSNAILKDSLERFHKNAPRLGSAYVRSDNAGCFHGYQAIFGVHALNSPDNALQVKRIDFADPQGGKSICDRRAAHIKAAIRKYVNEGHDVRSAKEFLDAIKSMKMTNISVIIGVPPETQKHMYNRNNVIKSIMSVNNISYYCLESIRVWRQYDIGEGKVISCASLSDYQYPEITVLGVFDGEKRQRLPNTEKPDEDEAQVEDERSSLIGEDTPEKEGVFCCPDANCSSTFIKYGNLLHHLDMDKHFTSNVVQNLSDRTKTMYSVHIENKVVKSTSLCAEAKESSNDPHLPKGWGLKSRREVKRFTQSQKQYLSEKFDIGENTGQKCDPEDVSAQMRSVKDQQGKRLFKPLDFLTSSQISSYFSRLALRKRKSTDHEYSEEDQEAENDAMNFRQLADVANV